MGDAITEAEVIGLEVETAKERLDRYLAQNLPDLSRSRLQKLIEQGHLKLNDGICTDKKAIVKAGDRLTLSIPEPTPLEIQPEAIPLAILYEDEHLLVVDKPAGLVVHPAPGHASGTLVNALLAHCDSLAGIGGVQRPGIVHRLDKDTSGAMVVAKSDRVQQHMQAQIKAKTARRDYLGIVHGHPKGESGSIDLPIGRHPSDRQKMAVVPIEKGGRSALTHWQIREHLGNYSYLEFRLETGRTHQIRVHCAAMGHPLVGDPVYSSRRSVGVNLSGQVLHAWRLCFLHPITGNTLEAIAPLPEDFNKLLRILRH